MGRTRRVSRRKEKQRVTAEDEGKEMAQGGRGEQGEKSHTMLRERGEEEESKQERRVRKDEVTRKLPHHHSQETALPQHAGS